MNYVQIYERAQFYFSYADPADPAIETHSEMKKR